MSKLKKLKGSKQSKLFVSAGRARLASPEPNSWTSAGSTRY
jgi:hypothetical protein